MINAWRLIPLDGHNQCKFLSYESSRHVHLFSDRSSYLEMCQDRFQPRFRPHIPFDTALCEIWIWKILGVPKTSHGYSLAHFDFYRSFNWHIGVWNFSHVKWRTKADGVWEQSSEEEIWWGIMEEGDHLERGGWIILKYLLQKWDRKALAELVGLRIEVMALVNTIMNLRVP